MKKLLFGCWGLAMFSSAALFGQGDLATVTGLIADSAKAIVAGVNVTIRNTDTNIAATTSTNENGAMHVPMITSWPGVIPKGQVRRQIGNHVDLLPTICTAAGVPVPADRTMDGFDALAMAVSDARSRHDAIFRSSGGQLALWLQDVKRP